MWKYSHKYHVNSSIQHLPKLNEKRWEAFDTIFQTNINRRRVFKFVSRYPRINELHLFLSAWLGVPFPLLNIVSVDVKLHPLSPIKHIPSTLLTKHTIVEGLNPTNKKTTIRSAKRQKKKHRRIKQLKLLTRKVNIKVSLPTCF